MIIYVEMKAQTKQKSIYFHKAAKSLATNPPNIPKSLPLLLENFENKVM